MVDQTGLISWGDFLEQSGKQHSYKEALITQLEKDLGIEYSDHSGETVYAESFALIQQKAEANTLGELLYRIDLGEGKAKNCMHSNSPIDCLTEAILQREAQKVFFRIQYSSK